jgi:hypothetical protein
VPVRSSAVLGFFASPRWATRSRPSRTRTTEETYLYLLMALVVGIEL